MQRYSDTVGTIKHNNVGKLRYETMLYPNFPPKTTDKYIVAKQLDRLDLLANEWYQDSRLWWVIAKANNLSGGTFRVKPGTRIRIPFPLDSLSYTLDEMLLEMQF